MAKYTINEIKEKTIPVAQKYGIGRLSLFGSYARGDADENSDVDFYFDKGNLDGLIEYFSFVYDLEAALNCHVDVVSTEIQNKDFLTHIQKDGLLLYEAE